ncbi:DUF305 domain-containing protein [Aeromicrobium duanguangcaii]|uniref:DUF305 domain-containing protein n=1 Tax=Aeromicrobium duanguangcaii TaxID=2968086 RepID=A0ABY5KBX6_9ACTN|nr:DUF305 domain-containing protein [Aeromicrobium duanguangcaii]UUI67380.1 DUF305 domain-containing protein [Aeromicrobium duanguangcaii]
MRTNVLRPAALALAALALAACGAQPQQVALGGTKAADTAAQRGTVERPWGTVKTFPRLQKAEPPSAADVTFARDMIMHHRQAVELSENVRSHRGVDARIGSAARFIIQDQKNEITTMRAWLQAWQDSAGAASQEHDHDTGTMPGMLKQARVDEIATLDRPEAEVAFLVAMIEHHEGAIAMSQDYLPEQTNAFVRSTATHIIGEQTTEIAYMKNLLDERCGPKGPATCPRG